MNCLEEKNINNMEISKVVTIGDDRKIEEGKFFD